MKIFNTLSGRKEEFVTQGNTVKMYVCGVTPYDDCHIGHAMSYILFDVIRRYLESRGYAVKYVQNFTDIDDKIINRASGTGKTTRELADHFIERYFQDMDSLNIKRADVYPKATEEIPMILEVISRLVDKGHAYEKDDGVYFRVKSFPDYGALSRRSTVESGPTQSGAGSTKEQELDFALWKKAKPGEPEWESPWGRGRPGWHIECTAMSLKYLGETLDIHAGGQDLVFPHHENEIAQSECFTGVKPFARYWLHNGMLQLGEQKMSKSLGNLVTIREVLENFSADALRVLVLSSHYRSPLTYTTEALTAAQKGAGRIIEAATAKSEGANAADIDLEIYKKKFSDACDDDFNFAQGLSIVFDLVREINKGLESGLNVEKAQITLRELTGVLGLTLEKETGKTTEAEPFIELLISIRKELRSQKQWALADRIRSGLAEIGVVIEDTPKETRWKNEKKS
ncbi:MAG: cysteine--tRNA ligase [Dehalococcoidia bacterium]|nr:cysteine--tRNA ligase [Dehalococcoidia bacterium]